MWSKIPFASALLASANAAYLHNELSFGHANKISDRIGHIPHWKLLGSPAAPEILSNKVILTPPGAGNQRGGIWSEKLLEHSEWTIDVDFRATGPERGGGNLQVWYVRNGEHDVGTSSIYTAGKFDGLGIVIDQYAGSGGFVRGFLNDGTKEYKSHHAVDSLAFGHCQHAYRNLGRPSRLSIVQTSDNFKVTLDNTVCFSSPSVTLPLGYSLGISAASASDPDSFEVFRFVVTTESHTPEIHGGSKPPAVNPADEHYPSFIGHSEPKGPGEHKAEGETWSDLPEVDAGKINVGAQFADLHNRLQGLSRHLLTTSRDLVHYQNLAASRHQTILDLLHKLESSTAPIPNLQGNLGRFENIERKMDQVAQDVKQTKSDLHNALDQHVAGLRSEVRDTHHSVMGTVRGGAIGIGKFVFVVLGSQVLTVGAYLLYKKRKNAGGKKYL